jgi:hypothetical protein
LETALTDSAGDILSPEYHALAQDDRQRKRLERHVSLQSVDGRFQLVQGHGPLVLAPDADLTVDDIRISTEVLEGEEGKKSNVSSIEIFLKK